MKQAFNIYTSYMQIDFLTEGCLPKQQDHAMWVPKLENDEKVYRKGAKVRLVCSGDTRRFGPEELTCQSDGAWSDDPTCDGL